MIKIYKVTNIVNGNIYIGQTIKTLHQRWLGHCLKSSKCLRMKAAIDKYGRDNFKIEVLEECASRALSNIAEELWITRLDAIKYGYNIKIGSHLSEGMLKKIGDSNRGKKRTLESKRKMSEAKKGIPSPFKGIKSGRKSWNAGTKKLHVLRGQKRISVDACDLDGNKIKSFPTYASAARWIIGHKTENQDLSSIASNIRISANRKRGHVYRCKWKMSEDNQPFREEYKPRPPMITKAVTAERSGELVSFESLREAADHFGFSVGNITRSCKSHLKCGGYKFAYQSSQSIKDVV